MVHVNVSLVAALLVVLFGRLDARYYPSRSLRCGDNTLTCGSAASSRAGTLQFLTYPMTNCTINVKVDTTFCSGLQFGLYFNIRTLALSLGDSITISETTLNNYGTIVKRLPGRYQPGSSYPTSVAQLMSSWGMTPGFALAVQTSDSRYSTANPLTIDYNILNEYSSTWASSYCSALNGFVHDDIICDSSDYDRVNCPSSYWTTTGLNPAYSIASCQYGGGTVAGIVVGSILSVVLIVAIASVLCRRHRHQVVHQHTTCSTTTVGHHAAPVMVSTVNPNYGQPQYYQGAPPQYGATMPTPYPAGAQVVQEHSKQYQQ